MANTFRRVQPGWGPKNPNWQRFMAGQARLGRPPYKGEKHRRRDRPAGFCKASKDHRFINGAKNTRYNLRRKVDELRIGEAFSMLLFGRPHPFR